MKNKNCKVLTIVKYNPEYYSASGIYTKDEWTSYEDIGKRFEGKILTKKEYLTIENKYIETVHYLIKAVGANRISLINVYKFSNKKIFHHSSR